MKHSQVFRLPWQSIKDSYPCPTRNAVLMQGSRKIVYSWLKSFANYPPLKRGNNIKKATNEVHVPCLYKPCCLEMAMPNFRKRRKERTQNNCCLWSWKGWHSPWTCLSPMLPCWSMGREGNVILADGCWRESHLPAPCKSTNQLLFALVSKRKAILSGTPENCNGIVISPQAFRVDIRKSLNTLKIRRNRLVTSPSLEQVVFVRDTGRFHCVSFFPQFLGSRDFNSHSSFVTSSELGNSFESFQYRNHLWLQKDWGLGENCIIRAWRATMALSPYQRAVFS